MLVYCIIIIIYYGIELIFEFFSNVFEFTIHLELPLFTKPERFIDTFFWYFPFKI